MAGDRPALEGLFSAGVPGATRAGTRVPVEASTQPSTALGGLGAPRRYLQERVSDWRGFGRIGVEAGRAFAFPLLLTLLVGLFLLIQNRLDRDDPRLARSPLRPSEEFVEFE